jgi:hypothetical protein
LDEVTAVAYADPAVYNGWQAGEKVRAGESK